MDAAAELGRNPVSISTRFSLSMKMSRLTRDGMAEPISRDQILRHARGQGKIIFPVQLTTSRIGNLTRLIHTLLYVMTIHTYIGAGVETGMGVNEGAQDGNGDGSGDRAGMGTEVETHRRTPDGNGDGPKVSSEDGIGNEGNGNEGRVGDGEKEAKKRKKPLNSCRRQGGNGGDFGGTRKRCRKGSVGPVAANSNIVEINKEAGGGAQGTLSLSKNCTSRESVSPLSRLIRGFRNKYH